MLCRHPNKDCSRKYFDEDRQVFICESYEDFCSHDNLSVPSRVIKNSEYLKKREKGQTELL